MFQFFPEVRTVLQHWRFYHFPWASAGVAAVGVSVSGGAWTKSKHWRSNAEICIPAQNSPVVFRYNSDHAFLLTFSPRVFEKKISKTRPLLWPLGPSAKSSPTVPWQQRHDPNSSPQWSTLIGMSSSPWIFSTVLSTFRIKKHWKYLEVYFVCKIVWLHWILKKVSIAHSFRDSAVWPLDRGQNKWIDVSLMIHLQWFPPFHIFSNPAKIGRSPVHRP